jgi:hypothetical protein
MNDLLICNHLCVYGLRFKGGHRNLFGNEPIWPRNKSCDAASNTIPAIRIEWWCEERPQAYSEIGSRMVIMNLGMGGRIEVMFAMKILRLCCWVSCIDDSRYGSWSLYSVLTS